MLYRFCKVFGTCHLEIVGERDKVMRGLKTEETAKVIVEGFRTYYNFLRPHSALNGKTPAKEADVDLELVRNKWLGFTEASSRHKKATQFKL